MMESIVEFTVQPLYLLWLGEVVSNRAEEKTAGVSSHFFFGHMQTQERPHVVKYSISECLLEHIWNNGIIPYFVKYVIPMTMITLVTQVYDITFKCISEIHN